MFKRIGMAVLFLQAGGWLAVGAATNELAPLPEFRAIIGVLAERLSNDHVSGQPLDDEVSRRAWKNYIGALDPSRFYFLASDLAEFKKHELLLDDELQRGECEFAFRVFNVFRARVRERTRYVAELLDREIDLEADEVYRPDRKHANWPADEAERDELWRKAVKNEYVARVAFDRAEEKPAEKPGEKPDEKPGEPAGKKTPAPTPGQAEAGGQEDLDEAVESGAKNEGPGIANGDRSPRAIVSRRHRQFMMFMEGNDAQWVLQQYLVAVTRAYDPHCEYMSASAASEFDIDMKLELSGIGASLTWDEGVSRIARVLPGGPADRDGRLKAGDRIVAVAQEGQAAVDVTGWPLQKVVERIRGRKGTRVTLTVLHAADAAETDRATVEIVRDVIKLEDQAAKHEIREVPVSGGAGEAGGAMKLGVISLPAFYGDMDARRNDPKARSSSRDIERILKELRKQDVRGILLDLRNNGGGSLREAVSMTGLFIRDGPVVQVRQDRRVAVLPDDDPRILYSGPLVVLVNRNTASSSEILAGALQDYGRAVIVGDSRTHGKGTVQTVARLGRDEQMGKLKVTRALFYRISGSSTQLKGVTSDITVPSLTESLEIGEDHLDNALEWSSVRGLRHPLFADLQPATARLKERSMARQAADPDLATFTNLVARVDELRKARELPLKLGRRLAMGAVSRELKALQERVTQKEKDRKADLVMMESLRILADLAEAWPGIPGAPQAEPPEPEPEAADAGTPEEAKDTGGEELKIEAEIPALIERLGHADPAVRREAKTRLRTLGRKARPALEENRNHRDPEVRSTVRELLSER